MLACEFLHGIATAATTLRADLGVGTPRGRRLPRLRRPGSTVGSARARGDLTRARAPSKGEARSAPLAAGGPSGEEVVEVPVLHAEDQGVDLGVGVEQYGAVGVPGVPHRNAPTGGHPSHFDTVAGGAAAAALGPGEVTEAPPGYAVRDDGHLTGPSTTSTVGLRMHMHLRVHRRFLTIDP